MDSKTVQKYKNKSVSKLIEIAQRHFNAFIRKRDEGKKCISCDSYKLTDASHFYSAGHYPNLRFDEKNVHASCSKCNRFLHGNLLNYRIGLLQRYDKSTVEYLEMQSLIYKRNGFKWDRFSLIEIIETYKNKNHGL